MHPPCPVFPRVRGPGGGGARGLQRVGTVRARIGLRVRRLTRCRAIWGASGHGQGRRGPTAGQEASRPTPHVSSPLGAARQESQCKHRLRPSWARTVPCGPRPHVWGEQLASRPAQCPCTGNANSATGQSVSHGDNQGWNFWLWVRMGSNEGLDVGQRAATHQHSG